VPKPPRDVSVSDEQEYVEDGLGPPEDTDVFTRDEDAAQPERPLPAESRPINQPAARGDDPLQQLRHPEPSTRSGREPPRWMGLAVGLFTAAVVAFALVVLFGVGLAGLLSDGQAPEAAPAAAAPAPDADAAEAPPDRIQGVKVRRGLKGSGKTLPPKKRDP